MIKRVLAENLKGNTFNHELGPVTLVTGGNDKGKTSIRDACLLALLGYHPKLGKTAPAIFELCSGSVLKVGIHIKTTQGEAQAGRTWTKKGKSVTTAETGTDSLPALPLVMLDSNDFFGRSDAKKVQLLFELLDIPDGSKTVKDTVRELQKLEGVTLTDTLEDLLQPGPDETLQSWIERVIESLAAQKTIEDANLKRYQKTQEGISELALKDEPVDGQKIARQQEEAANVLQELTHELGGIEETEKQAARATERRREIRILCDSLRASLPDRAIVLPPLGELKAARMDCIRALETLVVREATVKGQAQAYDEKAGRMAKLRMQVAGLDKSAATRLRMQVEIAAMEKDLESTPAVDIQQFHAPTVQLTTKLEALTVARSFAENQIKENEAEAIRLAASQSCPCCGREGTEWQEALELKHGKRDAEWKAQLDKIDSDFRVATEQLKEASAELEKQLRLKSMAEDKRRALQDARNDLASLETIMNAEERAGAELADLGNLGERLDVEPITADVKQQREHLAELEKAIQVTNQREQLASLERELASLPELPEGFAEKASLTRCSQVSQKALVEELKAQGQKAANQAADRKRLAEAQQQTQQTEVALVTIKTIQKHLKLAKESLVAGAFAPLLETAKLFTANILPTNLCLNDGELGRYNGGSWVPVRLFGGAFSAATHAALSASLSAQSPSKVLIMDELDTMDAANKKQFMGNVAKALEAGVLDQFIGMDVRASDYKGVKGLTQIDLGK